MDLIPAVVAVLGTLVDANSDPLFPGGVYGRAIKPKGRGATSAAWDANGEILVCGSVTATTTDDPSGIAAAAIGTVTVWIRGPESNPGRTAVRAAVTAVIAALFGTKFAGPNGTVAVLEGVADRLGVQTDPNIDNAVLDYVRFQAAGMWR